MHAEPRIWSYAATLLGSPILLKLFHDDPAVARRTFRLIKQLENLLTVNRTPSQVMDINLAAGRHPVTVSAPVFALIARAQAASLRPDSLFNFAIGPLVKRWKIGFRGDSVPPAAEIAALLPLTDPQRVVLDAASHTVWLPQAGMALDLGAIAKGYIADRVRDDLRQQQVDRALINLGGNVHTLGAGSDAGWSIGLKTPFAGPETLIGALQVRDRSVVTSGIYERWFEQDGRLWHHILDPKTGYPLDNELLSVTVISADSIDGDIWTTLLYGMGVERGLAALAQEPALEAIFVTRDRRVIPSSQRHYTFTLLDDSWQWLPVGY
ncbi:FAD:protein FMN transferase [Pantoea sp. 1.19]|uniref:FAD:protein FMN transferase n=1 Tax=Pantoea sp. 1.19 TaxID=1925589 RepID=UPI0009489302|nr:FAD:protein FMN transferase [Pantoea sp. 1.19]